MRTNIGSVDRIGRILVGIVLILVPLASGAAVFANPVLQGSLVIVGAVLIITALVRFCPLYTIFGLSTCKVPPND